MIITVKKDHNGETFSADEINKVYGHLEMPNKIFTPIIGILDNGVIKITDSSKAPLVTNQIISVNLPNGTSPLNIGGIEYNGLLYGIGFSDTRQFKTNPANSYVYILCNSEGNNVALLQNTVGIDGVTAPVAQIGDKGYNGFVTANSNRFVNGLLHFDLPFDDMVAQKKLVPNDLKELVAYGADCFFTYSNQSTQSIYIMNLRLTTMRRERHLLPRPDGVAGSRGRYKFYLKDGKLGGTNTVIPISQFVELNRDADITAREHHPDFMYVNFTFNSDIPGYYSVILIDYIKNKYTIKKFQYLPTDRSEVKYSIPFIVERSHKSSPENGIRYNVQIGTISSGATVVTEDTRHDLPDMTGFKIVLNKTISGLTDWSSTGVAELTFGELSFTPFEFEENTWRPQEDERKLVMRYMEPLGTFRKDSQLPSFDLPVDQLIGRYRPEDAEIVTYSILRDNANIFKKMYTAMSPYKIAMSSGRHKDSILKGYLIDTGDTAKGASIGFIVFRKHTAILYTDLGRVGRSTKYNVDNQGENL